MKQHVFSGSRCTRLCCMNEVYVVRCSMFRQHSALLAGSCAVLAGHSASVCEIHRTITSTTTTMTATIPVVIIIIISSSRYLTSLVTRAGRVTVALDLHEHHLTSIHCEAISDWRQWILSERTLINCTCLYQTGAICSRHWKVTTIFEIIVIQF